MTGRTLTLAIAATVLLSAAVQAGGQAVIQVAEPLTTLDPLLAPDHPAMPLLYSGLLSVDQAGRARPELASAVPSVESGTIRTVGGQIQVTYRLRSPLSWHDGRRVQAADAVFTWQALKAANSPSVRTIVNAEALDAERLRLTLSEKPANLATLLRFIVPRHPFRTPAEALEPNHPYWQHPAGTGPFQLAEWVPGTRLRVNAYRDYYRGRARLDQVVVQFGRPLLPSTNGHVQFWADIPLTWWPRLAAQPTPWQLAVTPKPSWQGLRFNFRGPLAERPLRHALLRAIDRSQLVEQVFAGKAEMIAGIRPGAPAIPYSLSEAKRLWAKEAAVLKLVHPIGGLEQATADALVKQWRSAGIPVTTQALTATAYASAMAQGDFDIALSERQPGKDDGMSAFASHARPPVGHNESAMSDPRLDQLLASEAGALSEGAIKQQQAAVNARLSELAPGAALFYLPTWHAHRGDLVVEAAHPWGPLWEAHRWQLGSR